MTTLHYVDGLCGSAKTYAAIRYAFFLAATGMKVLLVQASKHLINQTIADLTSLNPAFRLRAIHGDVSASVIADIVNHFNDTGLDGEILLITDAALMLLPYIHRRDIWHVIVDEIPQVDWCAEFSVPNTHRLITDCCELAPDAENLADNRYVRVIPKDRHLLEAMARNRGGDEVWEMFQPFANTLLSPHRSAYVLEDQYLNLLNAEGERRKLLTFAHLQPSLLDGFASATVMGACFKESVLYQLWSSMDVEFRPHKAITAGLRYQQHGNGALLTIRYATEDDWSKNFRNKILSDDGVTVNERVVQRVGELFANVEFAWMGNKDTPDGIFGGRGKRLPNSPFGLNAYQHIHNAVILSALNPPPPHFAFLNSLGINSSEVKRAGYWQAVYQAAMRSSLRNPDDTNPKTIIVMDKATADWMATLFPGCTVAPLMGIGNLPTKGKPGRRRQHADDADRKRAHRDRYKQELHAALDLVSGGDRVIGQFPHLADELRKQLSEFGYGTVSDRKPNLDAIGGSLFTSIYHAEPLDVFPLDDTEAFIDGLRFFHSSSFKEKTMNGLISPAIFDPTLAADTSRGLANIRAIWGIWLDNDAGDLTPQEFARLFPRLRMVTCNSHSTGPANPRWRAFIPTTVAMPIAAHQAIVNQIMLTLNKAEFWSQKQLDTNARIKTRKHHGFDMGKLVPSSLFYLPCQAADPAYSFFIDHAGKGRLPLDPYEWAGYAANHARPPEPVPLIQAARSEQEVHPIAPTTCPKLRIVRELLRDEQVAKQHGDQTDRRQAAIERWRIAPPNTGNAAFFQLGVDLRGTGMALPEIETVLRQEAEHRSSRRKRRRQIKSVMRSLGRGLRTAA